MPLTSPEDNAVQACIQDLLNAHVSLPFGILREHGVVSDLRGRLVHDPAFNVPIAPVFIGHPYQSPGPRTPLDVRRIQQEIKLPLSSAWLSGRITFPSQQLKSAWQSVSATEKTVDIAILSSAPQLTRKASGPGDVVARLNCQSMAGAIEVKASPSAQPGLKGDYVKDILALLDLARSGIDGYFVLLDKSLDLYGSPGHPNAICWDSAHLQKLSIRESRRPSIQCPSLKAAGVTISASRPVSTPHIQVWTIGRANSITGAWAPVRYYAS